MSIPLVQNNEKDSINISIIAIKKNLERINSLLGLADSSEPDLSGLATKQELEDAVTEINNTIDEVETSLQPIDTVTSGNMHSVTSNAVASLLVYEEYEVNLSYNAGAIGSRGNQARVDVTKNGYTPISFEIVYITDSAKVIPLCFCANNINQLIVNSYRTTTNAETVLGRVRVTYRKIP